MEITELAVPGAYEIVPRVFGDPRGSFHEWFRIDHLAAATGHDLRIAQANCSVSAAGTVRGIHFADVPPGQAKYVTCLAGAILDVIVDLRVGSPTFGASTSVLLEATSPRCVYLTEGLGHGFMALEDTSVVAYLCSTTYNPTGEHGVHPLDPDLGLTWPTAHPVTGAPLEPLLSEKDAAAPSLAAALETGLLPSYDACAALHR